MNFRSQWIPLFLFPSMFKFPAWKILNSDNMVIRPRICYAFMQPAGILHTSMKVICHMRSIACLWFNNCMLFVGYKGVWQWSITFGVWPSSNIFYEHTVSETGSISILRRGGKDTYPFSSVKRASPNPMNVVLFTIRLKRSLLRHHATSLKVAGSIRDEVIEIFN
jgi:hypothetical protein